MTAAARAVEAAVRTQELKTARIGAHMRAGGSLIVAIWLMIENGWPDGLILQFAPVLVAANGYLNDWLMRHGHGGLWWILAHPLIDAGAVVLAILTENPFAGLHPTAAIRLQFDNVVYMYLIVALHAATYRPLRVLAAGVATAIAWTAAHLYVWSLPGVTREFEARLVGVTDPATFNAILTDPNLLSPGNLAKNVILLLLVAGFLAFVVQRARRLIFEQAEAARQRANLARYFPPAVADEMARAERPLDQARTQPVAVVFVDVIGFTGLSERLAPEQLIGLLRDLQGRLSREVFEHGGTLEKFTGDGLMATFGTPEPGPLDASNALTCAGAMTRSVGHWNRERRALGLEPVRIGVGLHHGPVVLGNIGDRNRLEFAVLGDTVNVASRLERLTRELGAEICVSDDLIEQVRRESGADWAEIGHFRPASDQRLKGRGDPIGVWTLAAANDDVEAGP